MTYHITLRGLASQFAGLQITRPFIQSLPRVAPRYALRSPFSISASQRMKKNLDKKVSLVKKARTTPRRKKRSEPVRDPKVVNMLRTLASLSPRRIPPPLLMARNRFLRHWTIHRAWLLFRRRMRERREKALMQLQMSMSQACEELRRTSGPGTRPEGYLYRVAMEKKGVYGLNGIPIEYARPQVESPPRVPWDHNWKP